MDSKSFENSIKNSFESANNSLPNNLWENLSDKLSHNDAYLDKKVKESFEEKETTPPTVIWESVNRQLHIDSIWKTIAVRLDRHAIKFYKKELALLIGIIIALLTTHYYLNDVNNGFLEYKSKADKVALNKRSKSNSFSPITNSAVTSVSKSNVPNEKNYNSPHKNINAVATKKTSKNKPIIKQIQKNDDLNPQFVDDAKLLRSKTTLIPITSYTELDSIYIKPANLEDNIDSISKFKKSVEFGVTTSYNNTWVLNNDVRNSFNQNSLTTSRPSFSIDYGVVLTYNFSMKSSLSSEFYINSRYKQSYSQFSEGYLITKNSESDYYKSVVLYEMKFLQHKYAKPSSNYVLKAGPYFSVLKNQTQTIHSRFDLVSSSKYSNIDYGLRVAAGINKSFRNLQLGYGVNFEYGIKNILEPNDFINPKFNPTKNLLGGIYLNARYRISKK